MPDREYATLEDLIHATETTGPLVVETWTCRKCGVICFEIHKFAEVVSCTKCGHRQASKAEIYKFCNELRANA